jgi:hypothetical protein
MPLLLYQYHMGLNLYINKRKLCWWLVYCIVLVVANKSYGSLGRRTLPRNLCREGPPSLIFQRETRLFLLLLLRALKETVHHMHVSTGRLVFLNSLSISTRERVTSLTAVCRIEEGISSWSALLWFCLVSSGRYSPPRMETSCDVSVTHSVTHTSLSSRTGTSISALP